ncbi:MAG: TIM44-like domain-containing protein [Azoarcus sp.]|jgi:hypothetical protein|nr:TIM44-like domain-containing protein [Azoarcus sp.]
MKKRTFTIISLLLLLVLTFHFGTLDAIADFGNFSGDSDYGGSSSSSSSSSVDYDYGRSDYSGSGSGVAGGIGSVIGVLAALGFMLFSRGDKGGAGASRPAGATSTDPSKLHSIIEYCQRDTNFSEPELQGRISNLYIEMQNCWTAKNIESLRPCFTDTTYAKFDRLLDGYRQNCRTNYVERISVLAVDLLGWYEQENNDCMVANVRTRIVDYTKDDKTDQIIAGSATAEKFMTYEYILVRSSDYVTNAQDKNLNCPNCNVSLDADHSGKCSNCGSIITTGSHDWVISSIRGIAQETK